MIWCKFLVSKLEMKCEPCAHDFWSLIEAIWKFETSFSQEKDEKCIQWTIKTMEIMQKKMAMFNFIFPILQMKLFLF